MKTAKSYTVLLFLFLLGCTNKNRQLEDNSNRIYYTNAKGEKVYKDFIKNKSTITIIDYLEDGSVHSIGNYALSDTSKKNGSVVTFFPSGKVLKIENYTDNIRNGENITFYENQILDAWYRCQILDDDLSSTNEWIYSIDSYGNIDNQLSNFYTVKRSNDTVSLGDIYRYEIDLIAYQYGDDIYSVTGEFDDKFNIIDSTTLDTTYGKMSGIIPFVYKEIKTEKRGWQTVKGKVYDVKYKVENDIKVVNHRDVHRFQLKYFVK